MADSTKEWMQSIEQTKVSTDDARLAPLTNTLMALLDGATALTLGTNTLVQITPSANVTLTTSVPVAGSSRFVKVLTTNTTSRTITFGAGFKVAGTLATGTAASRVFIIAFVSDGTNLYEVSRTVALPA